MNDPATTKIKLIKGSGRCLTFGLLGLLPVIGLPFALAALVLAGQARAREKYFWNPARTHRLWGLACAAVGTVVWSVVDTLLIIHAYNLYIAD